MYVLSVELMRCSLHEEYSDGVGVVLVGRGAGGAATAAARAAGNYACPGMQPSDWADVQMVRRKTSSKTRNHLHTSTTTLTRMGLQNVWPPHHACT